MEDRPQSPPPTVVSSATQPLSVSFTKALSNPDCRSKLQNQSTAPQSRLPASPDTEAIPQPPLRHPLSSPEAYNQLLSIRQTIRDETAARQPPQQATLPDVLEQDLQHRATRESLVQLMKQLTLQNEQRAKHHKHHKKGHPSQHKRSKNGSRRHKRQRSPQPFQPEQQPEPTTSKELTIQQMNALLQAAKQEAKLKQPHNPDAPTLSQHNTNTPLSPHNTTTTDSQEGTHSAPQCNKRKHKSSSSPTSTDSHPSARPLGMSKRRGHRHNKKHKRRHRHSSSSSSSSSSDSDTTSRRSSRINSCAFRKYADRVSISFKWPNEFIGRTDGVSPTYQDLTFTEFMFGIVSGLLEQTPSLHQNRYLTDQVMYLRELFRDAMTTSLQDTMTCHRRVLEALEKGELDPTSWS